MAQDKNIRRKDQRRFDQEEYSSKKKQRELDKARKRIRKEKRRSIDEEVE